MIYSSYNRRLTARGKHFTHGLHCMLTEERRYYNNRGINSAAQSSRVFSISRTHYTQEDNTRSLYHVHNPTNCTCFLGLKLHIGCSFKKSTETEEQFTNCLHHRKYQDLYRKHDSWVVVFFKEFIQIQMK